MSLSNTEIRDRLQILKGKVLDAKEFNVPFDYFLALTETPGFTELGEKVTEAPLLQAAVAEAGSQLFGERVTPAAPMLMLVRLTEFHFVHGACMLGGGMATLFFFENLGFGMMAVHRSPEMIFTRIVVAGAKPPAP